MPSVPLRDPKRRSQIARPASAMKNAISMPRH